MQHSFTAPAVLVRIVFLIGLAITLGFLGCTHGGRSFPEPGPERPPSGEWLDRDSLAKDSVTRDSLIRDSLAKDSVLQDSLAGEAAAIRDSLAADSAARDSLLRSSPKISPPQVDTAKTGRRCILDFRAADINLPPRVNLLSLENGKSNAFVGGRTVWTCRGDDLTLTADSAEYYGDRDELYLIGNVTYRETRATIDAQRMTYWTVDGRLLAEDKVFAITESGATMRGEVAEYFRAMEGIRDQSRIVATQRPQLAMPQRDSATNEVKDTIHMVADRIESYNDSLVYAFGTVVINRSDIDAVSDSAFFDDGAGTARLNGNPVVNAKEGERPFTLKGDAIDIFSDDREVNRIVASPQGHAISEDLDLKADTIDIRVGNRKLERVYAWGGPQRATAVSPEHTISADSIEAVLPDQRIRELRAIRGAHAQTTPDTATIITDEMDWMMGDTIIAIFDTAVAQDSLNPHKSPPIREIESNKDAKAFYHTKNSKGIKEEPGINYVRGDRIRISFREREVDSVVITGQANGVYLEPEEKR